MTTVKLTDAKIRNVKPPSREQKQVELWDSALPGFGLRVGHGGRKAFMLMTRVTGGKQHRYTVGTYPLMTLGEAREAAQNVMRQAADGIDPKEQKRRAKLEAQKALKNNFAGAAVEFLKNHANDLRTADEIRRKIEFDLLPAWGDRPLQSITRRDVREMLDGVVERGSPVSANRLFAVIRKLFNWAVENDRLEVSPAFGIKPPTKETERERILGEDEIRAVWKACDKLGYPFGPMFRLLMVTAQRRSEVAGMTWDELDIDKGMWTLAGDRTKSGKGNEVPLSTLAIEILESVPRTGQHVFTSRAGDWAPSGFGKTKARLDRLCGFADWRLHDLRRTAASGMAAVGTPVHILSRVLNHISKGAQGGVTRIYDQYGYEPEKRRALEGWARTLRRIIESNLNEKVVPLRG